MALNIQDDQTEHLAREVARETGETLIDAIQTSLQERLRRLKTKRRVPTVAVQIDDLLRRIDSMPTQDSRSDDEILGYDQRGLPWCW